MPLFFYASPFPFSCFSSLATHFFILASFFLLAFSFSLFVLFLFSQGDVLKLTEDMQVLKPTIFVAVPRLLNKIYQKVRCFSVAFLSISFFAAFSVSPFSFFLSFSVLQVMAAAAENTGIKKLLGGLAVQSKKTALFKDGRVKSYWDWIVFNKVCVCVLPRFIFPFPCFLSILFSSSTSSFSSGRLPS
jgi:hypothetical protein